MFPQKMTVYPLLSLCKAKELVTSSSDFPAMLALTFWCHQVA